MSKLQQKRIDTLRPLVKAIRMKCLDCCAGSCEEVAKCPCKDCTLWIHRKGEGDKQ